jgi:hypothetical protein
MINTYNRHFIYSESKRIKEIENQCILLLGIGIIFIRFKISLNFNRYLHILDSNKINEHATETFYLTIDTIKDYD